jgi:hypothetical protein
LSLEPGWLSRLRRRSGSTPAALAYEGDLKSGSSWIQVTPPARPVTDNHQLQQQLRIFAVGLSPLDALSAATICFDYFVDAVSG